MTPDLEATLRAALARATPLPWYTLDPPWLPGGAETSILAESPDPHVARFICDFDLWALDDDDRKSESPDADAALIVAAVNALPTLLDTLTALRAQVEAKDVALREARAALGPFAVALKDEVRNSELIGFLAWSALQHRRATKAISTIDATLESSRG